MGDLNFEESFKTLGINPTSSAGEIKNAYHELSKKYHPDSLGGNHDEQAKLNSAYETALKYSSDRQLVAVEVKKAIQIVEHSIARQQASQEISTFSADTLRLRTQGTQRIKYIAFLAAGIAGFFGFVASIPGMNTEAIVLFKTWTIIFAAVGGGLQFLIQLQSQIIDTFREALSDENNCIAQLRGYGVTANQSFTLDDVLQRLGLLRQVRISDPSQLTLQEMIELRHGITKTDIDSDIRGSDGTMLGLIFRVTRGMFRLSPTQAARMTILKGEEHGILENIAKRPKTYVVTSEFKSMFH